VAWHLPLLLISALFCVSLLTKDLTCDERSQACRVMGVPAIIQNTKMFLYAPIVAAAAAGRWWSDFF
jgi:hypothetical protein